MKIRTVDLFAGCGGLSLGFQNAGFDLVAAFENWDAAINVYKQNFSHPVFKCDLSDVDTSVSSIKKYRPDLIVGGPPCQDFSSAGKRVEDARANLTVCYAKIVTSILPKAFVMENVDQAQKSKAFANAKKIYKSAGYGLTEVLLTASYCGVPQRRKRLFCIGVLGGKDNYVLDYIQKHISGKETTLRDYYGDSLGFQFYYRHPRNYNRRAVFSIDEPAPTMRGVNRPIPKGYKGHFDDACPISPKVHALSTADRALIQTFPKSFIWSGSKTDIEQMIGNAVPAKLAEFVAHAVATIFDPSLHVSDNSQSFLYWLQKDKKMMAKSSNDVISRANRAQSINGPIDSLDEDCYVFLLERKDEYKSMSKSVQSQTKRALHLLFEYRDKSGSALEKFPSSDSASQKGGPHHAQINL